MLRDECKLVTQICVPDNAPWALPPQHGDTVFASHEAPIACCRYLELGHSSCDSGAKASSEAPIRTCVFTQFKRKLALRGDAAPRRPHQQLPGASNSTRVTNAIQCRSPGLSHY
jgi:hypothetical protein